MQINVIYFASLRDSSGKSEETIQTQAKSVEELYNELNSKYQFGVEKQFLRAAQNEEYVDFNNILMANDTIVFIPPVAGG